MELTDFKETSAAVASASALLCSEVPFVATARSPLEPRFATGGCNWSCAEESSEKIEAFAEDSYCKLRMHVESKT
jgi:hypothetical protein